MSRSGGAGKTPAATPGPRTTAAPFAPRAYASHEASSVALPRARSSSSVKTGMREVGGTAHGVPAAGRGVTSARNETAPRLTAPATCRTHLLPSRASSSRRNDRAERDRLAVDFLDPDGHQIEY